MEKDKRQCIIHYAACDKDDEHLVSPKDISSWLALLEAAKVRNHQPVLDVAKTVDENHIPNILYHRKCRSLFTMKRDLETLKRKRAETDGKDSNETTPTKRQCRRPSTEGRVYEPVCIFCNKVKFLKNPKSREKLIQAVQLRADHTLRQCAILNEDARIIAITSRDIVAAGAHYHASCYKSYTNIKEHDHLDGKEVDNTTEITGIHSYEVAEIDAYKQLFHFIRNEVIQNKVVVPVAQLTEKLAEFMFSKGEVLKTATKKNIRRKLETEFSDSVHIFPNDSGKLLLAPDSFSFKDVVLENENLRKELAIWKVKLTDANKITDQASLQIREAIRRDMKPTPWPCHPSDLSNAVNMPTQLHRFLIGLLTGNPENENPSDRVSNLVQSFGQDLIYAVTCGQHKSPKHVLLPYAVKTLTGNTEIIKALNRFGHGMSYTQLEENDTALSLQKLAAGLNERVLLPTSIKPHVFTTLAWDNIDRVEETLSGKGTSHRVNGVAVQPTVFGPDPPPNDLPRIDKLKQRTLSTEHQSQLEVYVAGSRVGPHPLKTKDDYVCEANEAARSAHKKNILWILARQTNSKDQKVPSWTGFNIQTRDQVQVTPDVIQYLPTINAPATELSTVFEILNQSEEIRKKLCLSAIVVVMDQALYAKAAEIAWKQDQFSNIVLRMGTFHTICNALAILGKRFGDGGLKDIFIESQTVAEGSISGVIDGKHYNRGVRAHKYLYEALMRLAWAEFMRWLETSDPNHHITVVSFLEQVDTLASNLKQEGFEELLQSQVLSQVMSMWREFLNHLRHNNGELSAFWMSYVDMVEGVLLGLLRASREGDWDLHLHSIRMMIPWCFAYDKVNYARYLTPYFAQMTNLAEKNPEVQRAFKTGSFSVQLSTNNPFGRIPVDQTTEVTVNKDTQNPGGTTRFSLKPATVQRYYLTAEYRSAFLGQLRNMVQGSDSETQHTELQRSRTKKDEQAVSSIIDLIQGWVNPFTESQDLISISTAKEAPREIATDLKTAHEVGEKCYATFKEERMEKIPQVKKFHDPLKTNKLKTFSDMNKKKQVKTNERSIILKADRSLFGRIIVIAQGRNLQMDYILSHPLGPLPWALSSPDGLLRKTNKASLASLLQKNVQASEEVPPNAAAVIDGMSLVQRVKGDQMTFRDVAISVLSMAMKEGVRCNRIDVVFDTYKELSIKNSERQLRGEETGHQLCNITSTQIVRQWRNFLTRVTNKTSLICFIVNEWKKEECREKLEEKVLYANVGDTCYKITSEGSEEVGTLQCQQEEADGRLLLHASHAANDGYNSVLVCSEDTDVFIMSLAFSSEIGASLFMKSGTRARTKVIDITKVAASLGSEVCKGVLGMHAFTGCDTVSALAGRGKAQALKILTKNTRCREALTELGQEWDPTPELMDALEKFTCLLYSTNTVATRVNDLRYQLFCSRRGEIESHQLPPCRDCLLKHTKRANYQAAIWKRCLQQDPQVPSPVGRGWKAEHEDGVAKLVVDWMDVKPAPEAILELLACNCSRKCVSPNCVCVANGLRCTDMCRLAQCENQASLQEIESTDDEHGVDSDEEY